MKQVIIILMAFLFTSILHAQECEKSFIENLTKEYQKKSNKYKRIVKKSLHQLKKENIIFSENGTIIIPMIIKKKKKNTELAYNDFVCYLNENGKIIFNEAILLDKEKTLGFIIDWSTPNKKWKFYSDEEYIQAKEPLVNEILNVKADIIFSIYNIPNAYWYLKNNNLKVISYENKNGKLINFQTLEAKDYIKTLTKNELDAFLFFEKANVICY